MLDISKYTSAGKTGAAYRVMEEIENYEKIGGLQNEISKLVVQQYTIGQIIASREKAIAALIRLQALGFIFVYI